MQFQIYEHIRENNALEILSGDGWAYNIGFGGLDHVLAQQSDAARAKVLMHAARQDVQTRWQQLEQRAQDKAY